MAPEIETAEVDETQGGRVINIYGSFMWPVAAIVIAFIAAYTLMVIFVPNFRG